MRLGRQRAAGFTLIELLVVVGIIALLISILVPSLSRVREKAKRTICGTHMKAWGLAFNMYANDNNGQIPLDGFDGTPQHPLGVVDDPFMWFNGLTAYMASSNKSYGDLQNSELGGGQPLPKSGNNSIFICPSAYGAVASSDDVSAIGTNAVVDGYFMPYEWPMKPPSKGSNVSAIQYRMLLCYGMNGKLRSWNAPDFGYLYPGSPDAGDTSKLSQLIPSSLVVLFAEKRIRPDEIPKNDPHVSDTSTSLAQSKVSPNRFTRRHDLGGNLTFADGHVEWRSSKSMTGLKENKSTDPVTMKNYYNQADLIWKPLPM